MKTSDRLLEVLRYQLAEIGLTLDTKYYPDDACIVSYQDDSIAYIDENGFIAYPPDSSNERTIQVAPIVAKVWEMERAYQEASPMTIPSVSEYRKLIEFNRHILAARYDGEGQFRFVTWETNAERTGLALGHYFHRNKYENAKEDFITRSGLAKESTILAPHQLSVIRKALLYQGAQDLNMEVEERISLDRILLQIESILAPIEQLLLEAEKEAYGEQER
ncbi:hypothetical protein [Paenibacillus camerounensis]|uniref:hypothetical protein n=1 Tax=Paenibacillus camerounensis TaxID=1243663 RepID=UPI0005A91E34|nr:hypothetical protein [Paenibacillus camerounensis]